MFIMIVLSMIAHFHMDSEQLDVKTSFLHGDLEEIIFMKLPEGLEVGKPENKVCLLKNSFMA